MRHTFQLLTILLLILANLSDTDGDKNDDDVGPPKPIEKVYEKPPKIDMSSASKEIPGIPGSKIKEKPLTEEEKKEKAKKELTATLEKNQALFSEFRGEVDKQKDAIKTLKQLLASSQSTYNWTSDTNKKDKEDLPPKPKHEKGEEEFIQNHTVFYQNVTKNRRAHGYDGSKKHKLQVLKLPSFLVSKYHNKYKGQSLAAVYTSYRGKKDLPTPPPPQKFLDAMHTFGETPDEIPSPDGFPKFPPEADKSKSSAFIKPEDLVIPEKRNSRNGGTRKSNDLRIKNAFLEERGKSELEQVLKRNIHNN